MTSTLETFSTVYALDIGGFIATKVEGLFLTASLKETSFEIFAYTVVRQRA
jgi:hypothetical protein